MAEWLNNRILLVSVGYIRRGRIHDEDDGAVRSIRSTGIHKHVCYANPSNQVVEIND